MENTCQHCERRSCLPDEYQPLCARHYFREIESVHKEANKRFQAHIADLMKRKGLE